MNSKRFKISLVLFLITVIQACSAIPLTPSQTVEQFWAALLVGNTETAGRFATSQSETELTALPEELQGATVSFGEITISSSEASVATTLQLAPSTTKSQSLQFSTFLQRADEHWRVDWPATKKSLDESREERGIDKLVHDLEKLGRDLTGQLNDARKNWEEMEPEIKQDLEDLGESIQEDVQGAIDKYGPEIERKLQDLNKSLEEALKELEKAVPQQPEQSPAEEQPEGRMI